MSKYEKSDKSGSNYLTMPVTTALLQLGPDGGSEQHWIRETADACRAELECSTYIHRYLSSSMLHADQIKKQARD